MWRIRTGTGELMQEKGKQVIGNRILSQKYPPSDKSALDLTD
jgi:hypothetical protein